MRDDSGASRGMLSAEVVGMKTTDDLGFVLFVVTPVAAQQAEAMRWAERNLTAPSGIYVLPRACDEPCDVGNENYVVLRVGRIRQVTRREAESGWAADAMPARDRAAAEARVPAREPLRDPTPLPVRLCPCEIKRRDAPRA